MKNLNLSKSTIIAVLIMIGLMIITRSHSAFAGIHLADFTLPALIIAGVYFKQWLVPVILIVAAVAIDNFAIVYQGVSANCITPAYSLLPVLYLLVFWAAKKIPSLAIQNVRQVMTLTSIIVAIVALEWLSATMSYYLFTTAPWANFGAYALKWAPLEILPVLYWMVAIVSVISLQKRLGWSSSILSAKG